MSNYAGRNRTAKDQIENPTHIILPIFEYKYRSSLLVRVFRLSLSDLKNEFNESKYTPRLQIALQEVFVFVRKLYVSYPHKVSLPLSSGRLLKPLSAIDTIN